MRVTISPLIAVINSSQRYLGRVGNVGRGRRTLGFDALCVLGVVALTVALTRNTVWTGMNSPDSEFSASLVAFGDEVTTRAIDPAYYTTRLGYLIPMRALTASLGLWNAFEVWRVVLLLLLVGCTFWVVRRRSGSLLATGCALVVAMNTMILGYLGNPYATGTAIAGLFALIATGIATMRSRPRHRWLPAALAGGIVGWLVMINPYAALLGVCIWLAVRTLVLITCADRRWQALGADAMAAAAAFAVVMLGFLVAGSGAFPGDSWLQTYLAWNARLDYASFISDPFIWTHDVALLVMVLAVVLSGVSVLLTRSTWSVAALVIAVTNIVFALAYITLIPGPWLEAPHYSAMLWPAALVAISMSFAAVVADRPDALLGWLLLIPLAWLLWWSGQRGDQLTAAQAIAIVGVTAALCAVVMLVTFRASGSGGSAIWMLVILGLCVTAIGMQWLQNGRGWLGIYGQYPMNAAFVSYDAEQLMRSKIAAEEFVLENSSRDDRIGIWTDPDRLTAAIAAMQLWGIYNNVSANPVLDRSEVRELEQIKPTVIAMYSPTKASIDAFAASLPPWSRPSPLQCTAVPYLGIGSDTATICLTHLKWIG